MDNRLKKLGKQDLLEMILDLSKQNNELKQQIEDQKVEIESLRKQLLDKSIKINNAGTLAEASFQLNGIFEAAQSSAQQYLDNLQELYDREKINVRKKEKDVELKCAAMIISTEDKCKKIQENTMIECEKMKLLAKIEVEKYWDELSMKLEAYCKAHDELKVVLEKNHRL